VTVKVLRDLQKPPVQGVYPSRGFAFAEFSHHAHALAALRHLNNNPSYSSMAQGRSGSRLIVSFAVENHRKVQQKRERHQKGQQQQQQQQQQQHKQARPQGHAREGSTGPGKRKRPREALDGSKAKKGKAQ
jgi:nucleolar protein 4